MTYRKYASILYSRRRLQHRERKRGCRKRNALLCDVAEDGAEYPVRKQRYAATVGRFGVSGQSSCIAGRYMYVLKLTLLVRTRTSGVTIQTQSQSRRSACACADFKPRSPTSCHSLLTDVCSTPPLRESTSSALVNTNSLEYVSQSVKTIVPLQLPTNP